MMGGWGVAGNSGAKAGFCSFVRHPVLERCYDPGPRDPCFQSGEILIFDLVVRRACVFVSADALHPI